MAKCWHMREGDLRLGNTGGLELAVKKLATAVLGRKTPAAYP